jgi:hypothetical protein
MMVYRDYMVHHDSLWGFFFFVGIACGFLHTMILEDERHENGSFDCEQHDIEVLSKEDMVIQLSSRSPWWYVGRFRTHTHEQLRDDHVEHLRALHSAHLYVSFICLINYVRCLYATCYYYLPFSCLCLVWISRWNWIVLFGLVNLNMPTWLNPMCRIYICLTYRGA